MTRRRRRRSTRGQRRMYAAGIILSALVWAWQTHPVWLLAAAAAAALTCMPGTRRWASYWLRPTVVYKHRWAARPGMPHGTAYIGITTRPDIRCKQHQGKWWFPLCDPARYSHRWYRTRLTAALVERWSIRRYCPLGNQQHNRRYAQQTRVRHRLRTLAAAPADA